jgi:hypothetical protein
VSWAALPSRPENAQVYGKEDFPYTEAAHYSALLWHSQAGGRVGVILTIVMNKWSLELEQYVK